MSSISRRQVVIGTGVAAVAAGVGGSVWWLQQPDTEREAEALSLRLAWIPQATFSGDYAAELRGLARSGIRGHDKSGRFSIRFH